MYIVHLAKFDFILHSNQSEEDKTNSISAWDFICQVKLSIYLKCIKRLKFLFDFISEIRVSACTIYMCYLIHLHFSASHSFAVITLRYFQSFFSIQSNAHHINAVIQNWSYHEGFTVWKLNVHLCYSFLLNRFSIDRHKTKTKPVTYMYQTTY